jgi:hypothetical protein
MCDLLAVSSYPDHLDLSKYEVGVRDNARGRTSDAGETKVDDDDLTSLGLGGLEDDEDGGSTWKKAMPAPKRREPPHRLIEDPGL